MRRFSWAWGVLAIAGLASNFAAADEIASPEFLVKQAQEAEAHGNLAERSAKLQAALEKNPNLAVANWMAGRVKANESWQSAADARIDENSAVEKEYRERRDASRSNLKNLLELARWCFKQGWADRTKLHYGQVLFVAAATPDMQREAAKHLDLVQIEGKWVSREQAKAEEAAATKERKAVETWAPKLAELQKPLEADAPSRVKYGQQKLREIKEEDVAAATELFVLTESPKFAGELVALLGRINTPRSTAALARFAVLSPLGEIRDDATKLLEKRPLHEFVPMLVGALEGEMQTQFGIVMGPNGAIRVRQVFEYDAKSEKVTRVHDRNESMVATRLGGVENKLNYVDPNDAKIPKDGILGLAKTGFTANANRGAQDLADARTQQELRAAELASQGQALDTAAKTHNQLAKAYNERFTAVLRKTTGQNLPTLARDWWDWWEKHNDSQYRNQQPQYVYQRSQGTYNAYLTASLGTNQYYPIIARKYLTHSCFVAGTRVWTETGLREIETIREGDRVLAQNPDTGELAYRVVLRTTQRPQADLLHVHLADESLTASTGHPFWVNKRGWQMTKELKSGDILHTLDGLTELGQVEPLPNKATVYNLVVADWDTYFVGISGVLVHDVTYRQPTRAIVPGLVAKE